MRKNAAIGLLVSCVLFLGVAQAHGWGSAAHCYLAGEIGKKLPLMDANECYGIVGADIFNYSFELLGDQDLYAYL